MKKLFLSLLLLLVLPLVSATMYEVNSSITYYSDIYNGTVLFNLPSPQVNTSIYNDRDQLVYTGTMIEQNGSRYAINITINETGEFYRLTNYYSGGGLFAQSSESFSIVTNINNIAQDVTLSLEMIFSTFILFLVGLLIAIVGRYLQEPAFYFFAAVYFMGSSASLYFTDQGWTFPMFFALFGLLLAYKGVYDYYNIFLDNKNKRNINEYDQIE